MNALEREEQKLLKQDPNGNARFGWNDDDVVMRDGEGNVITPRQAREAQLVRLRSEVEEDVAADLS